MSTTQAIRVAIIDDDDSLCRSLTRLLQQAGFSTSTFTSAEEFLAHSNAGRPFGCLLVDIQLGGMSGIALHERLLNDGDRTPVIYLTAHDDPNARVQAIEQGCAAFFRKTDSGREIIEALRRASRT
jgi:FixJ family two-component response regulator